MADCEHGMPTPASCVECMAEGITADTPKLRRDGWPFSAVYEGICGGCTDGIEPGQHIVRMSDGAYRHVGHCEKVRQHG